MAFVGPDGLRIGSGPFGLGLCSLAFVSSAWSQWTPSGAVGAINTPTAQTLPVGSMLWGITNNIPEVRRVYPGQGAFGSTSLGFGMLPYLDSSLRLSYDGDPNCNQYVPPCNSTTRDLSLNAKFQLPVELPGNSRLAFGVTDFGGAATNYKQEYGVWTSRLQSWDWSVGYSRGISPSALIRGPFASASWWASPELKISLETRSNETRTGVEWLHRFHPKWLVSGALSSSLASNENRQKYQANFNLIYAWERDSHPSQTQRVLFGAQRPAQQRPATDASLYAQAGTPKQAEATHLNSPAPALTPPGDVEIASTLKSSLTARGFAQVSVGVQNTPFAWHVKAEPKAWRKSQMTAIAQAIAALAPELPDAAMLYLTLTYQQQAHRGLLIQKGCRAASNLMCMSHKGFSFEIQEVNRPHPTSVQWLIEPDWSQRLSAELELGPGLRQTVGTEYGLADYSLGLDAGWQVPIAGIAGLFAQGSLSRSISHSDDFGAGKVFSNMNIGNQVQQSLLSYVMHPDPAIYVQANYGFINNLARGSQVDGAWLSQDARIKLSLSAGQFTVPQASYMHYNTRVAGARYELVPTLWAVELTGGQYYYGDKGWQLSTQHVFRDYRMQFYIKQSASPTMPQTRFAGFTVSIPMGPNKSWMVGPLSLRGRDVWSDGLESKIGSTNNLITTGYGVTPVIRHGLNDLLDNDRRSQLNHIDQLRLLAEELRDTP